MNRPSSTTKAPPSSPHFRLHWPKNRSIELRPPLGSEISLLKGSLLHKMIPLQSEILRPMEEHLLLLDEQIIGRSAMSEALLSELPSRLCRSSVVGPVDQKWALAGEVVVDRRLLDGEDPELIAQLLSLAGPQTAALYVRRFNLPGFLASLWLPGYERWSSQLSPRAYIQQVWAGDLEEPALEAYLNFGAHLLGVEQTPSGPQALLAWADPFR